MQEAIFEERGYKNTVLFMEIPVGHPARQRRILEYLHAP